MQHRPLTVAFSVYNISLLTESTILMPDLGRVKEENEAKHVFQTQILGYMQI